LGAPSNCKFCIKHCYFLDAWTKRRKIRDDLEPLATKIDQSYAIASCLITRAWVEFGKVADLGRLQTALQRAFNSNLQVSFVDWEVFSEVQLSLFNFFRRNWTSALLHAQASSNPRVETFMQGFGVGTLFRQMAYGRRYRGGSGA
jgi:hypothetical protein